MTLLALQLELHLVEQVSAHPLVRFHQFQDDLLESREVYGSAVQSEELEVLEDEWSWDYCVQLEEVTEVYEFLEVHVCQFVL